jgi:hypothetical protein
MVCSVHIDAVEQGAIDDGGPRRFVCQQKHRFTASINSWMSNAVQNSAQLWTWMERIKGGQDILLLRLASRVFYKHILEAAQNGAYEYSYFILVRFIPWSENGFLSVSYKEGWEGVMSFKVGGVGGLDFLRQKGEGAPTFSQK